MQGFSADLGDWYRVAGLAGLAGASLVIGLSGALMPGPMLVAAIREGARQGHRAGPLLTLGHGILEAAVICLAYLGMAGFVRRPGPFAAIAFVGSAMLILMAITMLRSAAGAQAPVVLKGKKNSSRSAGCAGISGAGGFAAFSAVLSGAVVSLANPYWLLWWATAGLSCVTFVSGFGLPGLIAFFVGHISADLGWYWLVSYSASRGSRMLNAGFHRFLIVFCALFLLGFAGWFIYKGALSFSAARSAAADPAPGGAGETEGSSPK